MSGSNQPTDSKTADNTSVEKVADSATAGTDDLFSKTMSETKDEPLTAKADAPSNITTTENSASKEDFKSLEDQFSASAAKEIAPAAVAKAEEKQVKIEEAISQIDIKTELPQVSEEDGKIKSYKVQKGETLMLIAFKIYGDISKWKSIKQMNGTKLAKNSALRANMELNYKAPSREFVWNPEGTPYLIKNGETLGTISNSVYKTPKKWKNIWENNKPLIKNPNMIYAGFTLYYKGSDMANYVQPKTTDSRAIEEVKVAQAISKIDDSGLNEIDKKTDEKLAEKLEEKTDLTKEVQSSTVRNENNIQDELVH